MAGIIDRFTGIMSANINDILDKMEDPVKAAKKMREDYLTEIAEFKKAMAEMGGAEKSAKRHYDELVAKRDEYSKGVDNALKSTVSDAANAASHMEAAQKLEVKKQEYDGLVAAAEATHAAAAADYNKVAQMYNKRVNDLEAVNAKVRQIEATGRINQARTKSAKTASKFGGASGINDALDRFSEKVNQKADALDAMDEIDSAPRSEAESLLSQYGNGAPASVSDSLAERMKALGINNAPETPAE